MSEARTITPRLTLGIALSILMACGGGAPTGDNGDGGGPPPPPNQVVATVAISPDNFNVVVGDTLRFTATARDSSGQVMSATLAWGASGGTVTSSGLFTAGSTPGSASVWVTANATVSDTAIGVVAARSQAPADTIFFENFESGSLAVWDDRGLPSRHVIVTDTAIAYDGQRALEITYPQGGDGGWLTRFFMPGYDSASVSYYVKLQSGWLGGTKLISFYGSRTDDQWSAAGKASQCPNGTDFFVATLIAEAWANPGPTRFYTYYPAMPPDAQGNCYGSPGTPAAQYVQPTTLTPGVWHHVEYWVVLNAPGQNDASHQFWIDGVLRGSWSGFSFRDSDILRLNAITITASASGGAPQTQKMWVDNLLVSRYRP
jgi:hypothetical protein